MEIYPLCISIETGVRVTIIPLPVKQRGPLQLQGFDAEYLERLRRGDTETERHFVSYFSTLISIKTRYRMWPVHVADDIRQETLYRALRIIRSDDGVRHPERLGAFVNTICNHVMSETKRKAHAAPSSHDKIDCVDPQGGRNPEDTFITHEKKALVRNIIRDMAPRDRVVLESVFLNENTKDSVCNDLGVDRDYLRVLLHRAKTQFRSRYLKQMSVGRADGDPSKKRKLSRQVK